MTRLDLALCLGRTLRLCIAAELERFVVRATASRSRASSGSESKNINQMSVCNLCQVQ